MFESIEMLFTDYTLRTVALGAAIIGLVSGVLGCFAFLRRQSLVGDVIAHSSLAGITAAFLLVVAFTGSGTKSSLVLLSAAAVAGLLAMLFVNNITNNTRIKTDSALGIILAVFFGTGIFLLKVIQQRPYEGKAGLQDYIFGMAATITQSDVLLIGTLGVISLFVMSVFWKEFKIFSFDPGFTGSLGFSTKHIEMLLTALLVVAIVIGLQAVGVILMVTMIVAPAASARQWTNRLSRMVLLSGLFGMVAGIGGAFLSSIYPKLPTGPTVVLLLTGIFIASVLLAPERGIIARIVVRQKVKTRLRINNVLLNLYRLETNIHHGGFTGHKANVLQTMSGNSVGVNGSLNVLKTLGFVQQSEKDYWVLTSKGTQRAKKILEQQKTQQQ